MSLTDRVGEVVTSFWKPLEKERHAVAQIIRKATREMDDSQVLCSVIETAIENFSDRFIALVFWFLVARLPKFLVYKIPQYSSEYDWPQTSKSSRFWLGIRPI